MEVMLSNAYYMCTSETPCLNAKNMKDFREVVVDSLIGPQKKMNETTDKLSLSFCYSCYRKKETPNHEVSILSLQTEPKRGMVSMSQTI